jgi:hypothetical protein
MAWFTRPSHALLNLGFYGSQVDHSLFVYHLGQIHIFSWYMLMTSFLHETMKEL